jgi:hypothetical protein
LELQEDIPGYGVALIESNEKELIAFTKRERETNDNLTCVYCFGSLDGKLVSSEASLDASAARSSAATADAFAADFSRFLGANGPVRI